MSCRQHACGERSSAGSGQGAWGARWDGGARGRHVSVGSCGSVAHGCPPRSEQIASQGCPGEKGEAYPPAPIGQRSATVPAALCTGGHRQRRGPQDLLSPMSAPGRSPRLERMPPTGSPASSLLSRATCCPPAHCHLGPARGALLPSLGSPGAGGPYHPSDSEKTSQRARTGCQREPERRLGWRGWGDPRVKPPSRSSCE